MGIEFKMAELSPCTGKAGPMLHHCWCETGQLHVHCPCDICRGKAVPVTTGWRHRKATAEISRSSNFASDFHCESDSHFSRNLAATNELLEGGQDSTSDDGDSDGDDNNLGSEASFAFSDLNDFPMDDEGSDEGDSDAADEPAAREHFRTFIQHTILKLVSIKGEHGFSIKALEDLLHWGHSLYDYAYNNDEVPGNAEHWPNNWEEVKKMLEELGYSDAKLYWVCLDPMHPCNYSLLQFKDEECRYCGKKGTIPFYYLGLCDKIKRWCSSPLMCKKMTAHWAEKNHWMPQSCTQDWGWSCKKEIWDGSRFAELSYFWDPDQEWALPVCCPNPNCEVIISAETLVQAPQACGECQITCPGCFTSFSTTIQKTKGDPRNLAYIAHWDGWQPFSTSARGCGAIEITIATMTKVDRSHTDEVYVIGFVPSYLLPCKRPLSLDPFIEPLIREIEDGFINGINVQYSAQVCGMPAGKITIRHLILCWTGDHNGQCEVGKFIKCGKSGCRRCKTESTYIPDSNHYYYTGFRQLTRYPPEEKHVFANVNLLKQIEEEERVTVRQEMAKQSGYTGFSILSRLYPLYGFSYDQDLVFDEMHGIPLNVVKNEINFLKEDELHQIDWKQVDERLNKIPWTPEFKASRIPKGISKRLGYWKAEEYIRFAFPASQVAFDGLLSERQSEEWACISRIAEFLKNHARFGWSEDDANMFHAMALRYAVLVEENHGPTSCHITLHNLLHFKDDIRRFSGLDNYSCWVQERAVQRYINQSNNHKNVECTFASTEIQREVVKIQRDCALPVVEFGKMDADKSWSKTKKYAMQLSNTAPEQQFARGILTGGAHPLDLSYADCSEIARVHNDDDEDDINVERDGFSCRSVLKPKHGFDGLLYREKEFVVAVTPEGEAIVMLVKLFSTRVNGLYRSHMKVKEFTHSGYTGQGTELVIETDRHLLLPMTALSRKVILFPFVTPADTGITQYAVMDFMRRIFPVNTETVVIPYFPVQNDMIKVKGDEEQVWRARVVDFSLRRKVVQGRFFIQTDGGLWKPESSRIQDIHFTSILGISQGGWVHQYNLWQGD